MRLQGRETGRKMETSVVSRHDKSKDGGVECLDGHNEKAVPRYSSASGEPHEWVKRMKKDEASYDKERAARYVMTVRPAMASAKFVRADQDDRGKGGVDIGAKERRRSGEGEAQRQNENESSMLQSGEGGAGLLIGEGADTGAVDESVVGMESVMVDESNNEAPSTNDERPGMNEQAYSVEQARLERRRARKQAKRRRIKALLAKRRSTEHETDEEQRRVDAARRQMQGSKNDSNNKQGARKENELNAKKVQHV
ncbi:hypothetical protein PPTG_05661 [Phytophthora nicotianae INRA-310]|uniref:Uncharacterized protein n=1 Tax=Phytophthora nicotianae (strain INRA-310) TaxID=761204 RepID=W2QTF0_PHYN3|nr:hypothetical protein PPTG_05661 [Phytophthora nicotianae INRA-310]ETN16457.1 hypothetical protein PPTG_05661 [Phytophthora nicotianae INRA-310]